MYRREIFAAHLSSKSKTLTMGIGNGNTLTFDTAISESNIVNTTVGNGTTVQAVDTVNIYANGGTFKLTIGANTTPALSYNITAANLQAALVSLASVGVAGVVVTGGPGTINNASPYILTFAMALTNPAVTINSTLLTGVSNLGLGVIPGTVSVTAGAVTGTDNGFGVIAGTGISGTINYITGEVAVTFTTHPANTVPIVITFDIIPTGDIFYNNVKDAVGTASLEILGSGRAIVYGSHDNINWIKIANSNYGNSRIQLGKLVHEYLLICSEYPCALTISTN
jgi:hypothetical protein